MSTKPSDLPPTPVPLYWRVASALTVVLIAAVVGAAALGLSRHGDGRDHRKAVEAQVGTKAERLAALVLAGGPDAAKGLTDAASVHVVTVGGTDEFGISTGTAVAYERYGDPRAQPKDGTRFAQDLLNRSAEFDDYTTRKQPIPASRLFSSAELETTEAEVVFWAFAAVVKDGEYQALVSVSDVVKTPSPTTPTSSLLIGLLLALGLGFAITFIKRTGKFGVTWGDRLGFGAAAGLSVLAVFIGSGDPTYVLWPALVAALIALGVGRPTARLFRGVKEQPGTYLYIVPAMIGMIVLVFVPFIMGVALAFFSNGEFAGIDNFTQILSGTAPGVANFYWTTGFTILWTLSNVILHVGIGVALALVLNRENLAFKTGYRMLLVVPWAVPNYITALIWKSMFNPQFGAVNGLLDVFGIENVNWLGAGSSFWSNYIAALTTNTWLGFPFMMVVTLGALQSIPKDLYEAADIDGANRWQKFRQVTLPLLKPALVPAIILGVVWTFNMFNVIYLVSGGAPENQTNISR